MKFENTEVWGFEHALRGMRNPMNSWDKSDSYTDTQTGKYVIGENDMGLAKRLIKGGSEHRKFLRQIFVSVDITAPQYWIAELDTYKIGTVRDSCSFQHKGVSEPFSIRDFCFDDDRIYEILDPPPKEKREHKLVYNYETEEYKTYTVGEREYQVFKNGRVFSCPFYYTDTKGRTRFFDRQEKIPTQYKHTGYWYFNLGGRKWHERWLLHRLVAELWSEKPLGKVEVNHIDGNKGNNCIENLEWVTHSENEIHKHTHNLDGMSLSTQYLEYKSSMKIKPYQSLGMKKLNEQGVPQAKIAEMYNISQGQIWSILNDKFTSENHELFENCWFWEKMIEYLNFLRDGYLETKDYSYFRAIRQILPMGYEYKFTMTMNYENLLNMYHQRKNHKLNEWSGIDDPTKPNFIAWVKTLPYAKEFIIGDDEI